MAASNWTADKMGPQTGRTVLITGANSGIGYQTALELTRHGAHVLMACRSVEKGQEARDRIRKEIPGAQPVVVPLDVASLASVKAFAQEFVATGAVLDVLVNNAGVMALSSRELTEDGFERQFATNHLGHFALTGLLIPALLKSSAPRVVTVSSLAHRTGRMEWDNLQGERSYSPWGAYNQSKLANILFARELDRRAREQGSKLVSVAVHPGVSMTQIARYGTDLKSRMVRALGPILLQSEAMGSLPTLYAATAPDVQGGQYWGPGGFKEVRGHPALVRPEPQALEQKAGARLWQVSEELTGVVYPPLA